MRRRTGPRPGPASPVGVTARLLHDQGVERHVIEARTPRRRHPHTTPSGASEKRRQARVRSEAGKRLRSDACGGTSRNSAVTERFHAVGNVPCDWVWLSAGLVEPAREPWQVWRQVWPLGFDPVVYQVWTVTQREPLRVGVPAGSIWLDIDAAYDEAAMIETLHALIPPTP